MKQMLQLSSFIQNVEKFYSVYSNGIEYHDHVCNKL